MDRSESTPQNNPRTAKRTAGPQSGSQKETKQQKQSSARSDRYEKKELEEKLKCAQHAAREAETLAADLRQAIGRRTVALKEARQRTDKLKKTHTEDLTELADMELQVVNLQHMVMNTAEAFSREQEVTRGMLRNAQNELSRVSRALEEEKKLNMNMTGQMN